MVKLWLNVSQSLPTICVVCKIGSFEDSAEEWDRVFSVNTRGVFLCYKYAAKQLIAQGRGGRIIGAASIAGRKGGIFSFPL